VAGTLSGVPWSRETVYEDVARKQTEKDAKNQPTVHELDGLNRVTKSTDPAGKTGMSRALLRIEQRRRLKTV
jgi:hypothetical protein